MGLRTRTRPGSRSPFSKSPFSKSPISEEDRAFLQRRVATYGLLVGLIFLGFALFRVAMASVIGHAHILLRPNMYWHVAATGVFVGTWLIARRGRLSGPQARLVETFGVLGGGAAAGFMVLDIPNIARPDLIFYMAMSLAFIGRSIYVPSTARRTLILGIILGLDMTVTAYIAARDFDIEKWAVFETDFVAHSAHEVAVMSAVGTAAWWTASMVIAVSASAVIYGLRREVYSIRRLGQYLLEEKIGEGGMGAVYRAHHALLARQTAVKLLPPEKAGDEALRRFEREVRLTASLNHPNSVTVFDFGHTPEGVFYYAMELIDGATLQAIVKKTGPVPPARVLHLLHQVAGALVEAHGVGLIHRDIKPANIMVKMPHRYGGVNEIAKVVDFGLVKDLQKGDPGLTSANAVTGTPLYMSPEAISDPHDVGPLSDLYALGAVAYFALTGTDVFSAKTVVEVCSHHLHTQPEDPAKRLGHPLPGDLVAVVLDCLAKAPGARPPSALALQRRLAACEDFGRWTPDDAQAWWSEHREDFKRRPADGHAGEHGLTVDVRKLGRDVATPL